MTLSIEELEQQIARLSPAEKVRILQLIATDVTHQAWPGIERTPGVMGGDACLVRTRIPVWLVVQYRRLGWSEAQILENYPVLRAANLVNAWSYGDAHPDEIEQAIREQDAA